ncbi:unnamed protein product, partial [Closterium sp. Naga37s-1]
LLAGVECEWQGEGVRARDTFENSRHGERSRTCSMSGATSCLPARWKERGRQGLRKVAGE